MAAAEVGKVSPMDGDELRAAAACMRRGHRCNERGEYPAARRHFQDAFACRPSVAAQASAANMALKAQEPSLAAYEYEQLLLRSDLTEGLRTTLAAKLLDAEAAIQQQALSTALLDENVPWQTRLLAPKTALLEALPQPKRRSSVAAAHEPDAPPPSSHGFMALRTQPLETAPAPSLPLHELEIWQRRQLPPTAPGTSAGAALVTYVFRGVQHASHLRAWQQRALGGQM